MQFWPPDDEHMCSKHVETWNKLIVKQKFCASSRLITEMHGKQNVKICVRLRFYSKSAFKYKSSVLLVRTEKSLCYFRKCCFHGSDVAIRRSLFFTTKCSHDWNFDGSFSVTPLSVWNPENFMCFIFDGQSLQATTNWQCGHYVFPQAFEHTNVQTWEHSLYLETHFPDPKQSPKFFRYSINHPLTYIIFWVF